jgi:hypothetical protein
MAGWAGEIIGFEEPEHGRFRGFGAVGRGSGGSGLRDYRKIWYFTSSSTH